MSRFDRWRIVEAYHYALTQAHSGQGSREYARLCRMAEYYRPSPSGPGHQAKVDANVLLERWGVTSGYRDCACATCFEITAGAAFCDDCDAESCGDYSECQCAPACEGCGERDECQCETEEETDDDC